MRLFVGVWPSEEVLDAIDALPRVGTARWTRRDQWHVTLRFLGDVADAEVDGWIATVKDAASRCEPRIASLGPATKIFGRGVLMVPVTGLDDVAAALSAERFTGHLTLARNAYRAIAGAPIAASWNVTEIALIRSDLGDGPARYETIATGAFAR
jgi:2'-5' RNA ligase